MLAKALSKTSEAVFINVNIANILQKWWGESEKLVQATFSLAEKLQPSIIFIDEIDSLFRKRSEGDHEVSSRIKSVLNTISFILTQVIHESVGWFEHKSRCSHHCHWRNQSVDGLVRNNLSPHTIDDAILRRLPQTFHIGLPDVDQRERILSIVLLNDFLTQDFER